MRFQGLHHITMITGDARRTFEFYADLLGLRMVKKTVNFDAPEAYHLYFGDERGTPGSILTWFEFAGAARGRLGAGMIHTITLGVPGPPALDFWSARLEGRGCALYAAEGRLAFEDEDGLRFNVVAADSGHPPLRARHPEIPPEYAIAGVEGARAFADQPNVEDRFLTETLGFEHVAAGEYLLEGELRPFRWAYDKAPDVRGQQGAGTVHHIAWAAKDADHLDWQQRVRDAGAYVTDVRDRDYFRSIYFREPRGVLFEIATMSPGFAVDEDPEHLGESLCLPRMHAHLRSRLERTLTPLVNPRAARGPHVGV